MATQPPVDDRNDDSTTPPPPGDSDIAPISIVEEMKTSYLDYAMSVIVSRALPDVRDGLKPVHRRILFACQEAGYVAGRPYRKSSRIVGDVMGKYHPHGDSAIYDALARMVQPWSLRVPLVDGQGNFGSMDPDPPAAMRYTEARLAKVANFLLSDIDKDTVDFQPNYDASEREPQVLPARFPNLLVNGAGGIAVGMATNIPPHNLGEVLNACRAYIEDNGGGRKDRVMIETLRKIRAGEELTYDYGITLDVPHTKKMKEIWACRCGAKNCIGAGSDALAETTVVYSIAPKRWSFSTTCATVDCFWPIAT